MNRSAVLRRGMDSIGISQVELSRLTGLPPSKISRYVSGKLEPSESTLELLLSGLGLQVGFDVSPVPMERAKRRSWLLHRQISHKLGVSGIDDSGWDRMQRNLDRVRSNTQGSVHERNLDRWQRIIDSRDLRDLQRMLVDTSDEGIEMREVSPMAGFLTEDERLGVLAGVRQ
ncbi:MAG: helix-turn-helix transcriptional regulator [Micropruina sp.]